MGLDLSGVRRVVEGMLDDELQLLRDADGQAGDVLDEESGEIRPGGVAASLVWEGKGAVVIAGQPAVAPSLDGAVAVTPASTSYQALLPLGAPEARLDDVLVVKAAVRDAQLVGRRFRVADAAVGTFAVVRVVRLAVVG